jgi:hypothetical protein
LVVQSGGSSQTKHHHIFPKGYQKLRLLEQKEQSSFALEKLKLFFEPQKKKILLKALAKGFLGKYLYIIKSKVDN